ncbi:hypothetical protein A3A79_00935 [Candidatus Gottesmanbacteria bacterium RIFCSPLOWO2_01_FULL_43_11b]|uniref:ribose-phosphate diphosphokinase n=1 Tax=Candidatus Gottesmanbacteria bacterium RIFCSPLOWO2_01_FULL_43_11b TaxID=1798392 RepID=A0A1F6AGM9_9BACT|nr:MAG: hypothetical protein A3A79_00935 [Candidatus Gottesmanbacteria bacterium RIFCSPLOWO2_01_FULL_43_11b]
MQAPILLSGTSNEPLALAVGKTLNISLGKIEIGRFTDTECRVRVMEEVSGRNVFVLQSLSMIADQNLVELCLIGQALRQLKAEKITAIIPWMGYSKQDKEFRPGEAVSAQLIATFLEAAGFNSVITVELHSEMITPYFHIPIKELSTHSLFAKELKKRNKTNIVVVSPDMGGKSRSEKFAHEVNLPIVYLEKKRDRTTGEVVVTSVSQDVSGKNIVIFDDIINTGATVIKTSEFLKAHGAGNIYFMATHAVLAGDAAKKLADSTIDEIVVTDSIHLPKEKMFSKLSVISVAQTIADDIITP